MNILVVIEHSQGSIHRLSKEAIAGAQSLGNKVIALVIGERSEETISFLKAFLFFFYSLRALCKGSTLQSAV